MSFKKHVAVLFCCLTVAAMINVGVIKMDHWYLAGQNAPVLESDGYYAVVSTGVPFCDTVFTEDQVDTSIQHAYIPGPTTFRVIVKIFGKDRLTKIVKKPAQEWVVLSHNEKVIFFRGPDGPEAVTRPVVSSTTRRRHRDAMDRAMISEGLTPPDYWVYQWIPGTPRDSGTFIHVI